MQGPGGIHQQFLASGFGHGFRGIAGLVFVWGSEQMVFFEVLPDWYRHLRHLLTAAAVLALVIAWAAAMMSMF